jgi:hypothetical protein
LRWTKIAVTDTTTKEKEKQTVSYRNHAFGEF